MAKHTVGILLSVLHNPSWKAYIIERASHLAASRSSLVSCLALHLVVITEEVGVALVAEGQAQNSLGVCHSVALAVIHLAVMMPQITTARNPNAKAKSHCTVAIHGLLQLRCRCSCSWISAKLMML